MGAAMTKVLVQMNTDAINRMSGSDIDDVPIYRLEKIRCETGAQTHSIARSPGKIFSARDRYQTEAAKISAKVKKALRRARV
jgi:hypothetical protein